MAINIYFGINNDMKSYNNKILMYLYRFVSKLLFISKLIINFKNEFFYTIIWYSDMGALKIYFKNIMITKIIIIKPINLLSLIKSIL
jgi:hypothetical protein